MTDHEFQGRVLGKLDTISTSVGILNTRVAVLESRTEHLDELPTKAELELEVTTQVATCRRSSRTPKDSFTWPLLAKIMLPLITIAGAVLAAAFGIG